MANLIQRLTSISAQSPRSGPPPGWRLLAVVLAAILAFGSTFPGFAVAGEADSEGEGATPPIEVPVGPPDFDPGGEETGLEEEAPADDLEGATVDDEVEVEPAPEVTGAATEAPAEVAPPPAIPSPEPASPESEPAPEPAPQRATQQTGPVANQSIVAPRERRVESSASDSPAAGGEVAPPVAPVQQEAPRQPSPEPVVSTPAEPARSLAGRDTYVVRPGDCLWHIAADLLPGDASTQAIASEVSRLWRLNEDRIGTGDPNLLPVGTELRLD